MMAAKVPSDDQWNAEFERLGEQQVYDNARQGAIYNDERKRRAAFQWLANENARRKTLEKQSFWYAKWTFYAAVAAVVVSILFGVAGIVATLLH
jgi:hypothetical protein